MDIAQFVVEMNRDYYRAKSYHGMKNPTQDVTSGNAPVINAIYYTILNKYNAQSESDRSVADSYIRQTQVEPGLYTRAPGKEEFNEHDNYIGVSVTSKILHLGYNHDIVTKGEQPFFFKYYLDNTKGKFDLGKWFGRFPWLKYSLRVIGYKEPTLLDKLGFCGYIISSIRNKDLTDTSGRILLWLQKEQVKGQSKLVDWFINRWEKDLFTKYPHGMSDVFAIYYGTEHPFSRILRGEP